MNLINPNKLLIPLILTLRTWKGRHKQFKLFHQIHAVWQSQENILYLEILRQPKLEMMSFQSTSDQKLICDVPSQGCYLDCTRRYARVETL